MSGIKKMRSPKNEELTDLIHILDRSMPINSLAGLKSAINGPEAAPDIKNSAFGIDSSIFLRLGTHKKSADILDYFSSQHNGSLILPSQTIQEFWNNQFNVVETMSTSIRKKYDELYKEVKKTKDDFQNFHTSFKKTLDDFNDEHGYIYDEGTKASTSRVIELLESKAALTTVPRSIFSNLISHRQRTRTPPGFEDKGDGDFFVWAEFLYGLIKATKKQDNLTSAILLTADKKKDWSRNSVPHPILSSEVMAVANIPFYTWDLDQLSRAIENL